MSRWRIVVLLGLFFAPFLFLMSVGAYHLWDRHWSFYAWWPMALSISASFLLACHWQRKQKLMPKMEFEKIPHGTDRDQQAWKIVADKAKAAEQLPPERFSEPAFYMQSGQELALELARFYHPSAQDPYGKLTVPEMLAVAELAARDLSDLVQKYVPGSHLLTINDWKRARKAIDWYRRGSNIYWLAAAVFSPVETAVRYAASRFATGSTWDLLQQNMQLWFYTAYLHRLGTYLIELHSGRLRVGVERYRQLVAEHRQPGEFDETAKPATDQTAPAAPIPSAKEVTIAVVGQVKMGKSSVINALLGERKAITDVLPMTSEVTRYRVQPDGVNAQLVLLDTQGYGHEGPREDQLKVTEDATQQSDVILLVVHARNPARQGDAQMLERLRQWFARNPHLRMPPVVGVVTHIDLLSPALEWSPPYDWLHPTRPKEQQIHQALEAVRDQFAGRLAAVVPVCANPGKVFGIEEALLPALTEKLGEARAVALLRVLKAEADAGKVQKVFHQFLALGKEAARVLWTEAVKT
ncbi:MAG: GTPase family protein [Gemmataceae bacterium]